MNSSRGSVLGYPLDVVSLDSAAEWVIDRAVGTVNHPQLVVTLNPEIIVQAEDNPGLQAALKSADLSVADGVGVAWAAKRAGLALPGRVPGVELAFRAMQRGGRDLRVYFLGGKEGVARGAAVEAARLYGVEVAGHHHGYFDRGSPEEVVELVKASSPGLLLAGLGEGQELFLYEHAAALGARVMIGVGGTLDVLAGEVKRMPAWTARLGVEWLFRVALDRRRWGRAPRLARFVSLVLRYGR